MLAVVMGPVAADRAARFRDLESHQPHGTITQIQIPSRIFGRPRVGWIYTPSGYPQRCATACNLIVAFDGSEYMSAIPLPDMLDSLIAAAAIPPTIAVLLENGSSTTRLDDLANHQRFVDFVGKELIPFVQTNYRVTSDPRRTLITGSSAGGLASAYIALERPDLFGNVVSQSGAFWRGGEGSNGPPFEWVTQQYASRPSRDIRFILEVGSAETLGAMGGTAPSILAANRRLRDVLKTKGYVLQYAEVAGGEHSPDSWRPRLPTALASMLRR